MKTSGHACARGWLAIAAAWLVASLPAQGPPTPPPPPPPLPPPMPSPAEVERAQGLLERFAKRSLDLSVLVADYVQRRTTALSVEPLVSRGEFLYVREPACVMFRATAPRVSQVRLAGAVYEVYRPQQKQLERFHLDGPELADGLFAAIAGDATRLRADFDVLRCQPDPAETTRTQIGLVPKQKAVRERLQELVITLWHADASLFAVAYRDPAGDLVAIELQNLRVNPKERPKATLDVPKDTKVLEHRSKPAR